MSGGRSWADCASDVEQHHPHHPQQGPPPPQHLQHPRPSSIVHQQRSQNSPHNPPPAQSQHQGAFASPHASSHGLPSQHQQGYQAAGQGPAGQHPQEIPYFGAHPSPYSTSSASGGYTSAAETPEIMAAHMSRPYPPIYHTPQSNSPASVASPSGHDQHGRGMYGQPSSQLPQGMYGYAQPYPPMAPAGTSYAHQPATPQHSSLTSQPLLMSHQSATQAQLQHQPAHAHAQQAMAGSPRQKQLAQTPIQRPPPGPLAQPQHTPTGPPGSANSLQSAGGGQGGPGVNPNAAPGPIPATTPLVVRQDNNGVQWIAFEYSRDRVKMEYTIRCDVESVNVETLGQDFKTENCVYPRACCRKDDYRGNRLNYETECNTVGWALAELNPPLRGKRGLIQRAVDSWRNSNQDPRLRSRRVRRMAKINTRKAVQQAQHPPSMAGPSGPSPAGVPSSAGIGPGGMKSGMAMPGPQLHHHHAHPDGSAPGGGEDVSAESDYGEGHQLHHHPAPNGQVSRPPNEVRHRQVYHGYASGYPADPGVGGAALPPSTYDAMDPMGGHVGPSHRAVATSASRSEEKNVELFGDLPEAKRRKFILVDDPHRGARVRVRVMLDQVDMGEIPDSYRKANSVYPRSYFPMQTQSPSGSSRGGRFPEDDDEDEGGPGRGRTTVPVPMMDGADAEVQTPRIGRARRRKEVTLNDLGYRMSWSQSRVFAGRTMFLQKSLDAYRNKMHSTMTAAGQDVTKTAPHFETRVGKRKWLERTRRSKREMTP
ncbi:MAG: hypothetical protein M1832_000486 [Thelocarpon impressellum]|nr:MAG: hypothetical protein M1832_000486 [Thelocarpon impressellum]